MTHLDLSGGLAMGLDISWSRCHVGRQWLAAHNKSANLFVADLFHIPLADQSIDVVYTSHSLEPNGGKEEAALREAIRISRRAVVLVEPIYELASEQAQARMRHHGYIRGLKEAAIALGATISDYRLLNLTANPLNPSGVLTLDIQAKMEDPGQPKSIWRCPLTHAPMNALSDVFYAPTTGMAYPILREIPLLRSEHAVVASALERTKI